MDGKSREEALEVVGDVPDLCSALVGKGECLKGAKGREHHCQWVEQPAQFHKLLPLGEQLSLSGEIPRAAIQGILLPSPVEALILLWLSLEAAGGPGALSTCQGTEVPHPTGLCGGCQLAASRWVVDGSSDLPPQTTD